MRRFLRGLTALFSSPDGLSSRDRRRVLRTRVLFAVTLTSVRPPVDQDDTPCLWLQPVPYDAVCILLVHFLLRFIEAFCDSILIFCDGKTGLPPTASAGAGVAHSCVPQ